MRRHRSRAAAAGSAGPVTAKNTTAGKERSGVTGEQMAEQVNRNFCGVQLLDAHLRRHLFDAPLKKTSKQGAITKALRDQIDARQKRQRPDIQAKVEDHLREHNLWGRETAPMAHTPIFELPELLGGDIESHFNIISRRQSEADLHLAKKIATSTLIPMPEAWLLQPGWTRYGADGSTEAVECPREKAIVFDVEWCVTEGHYPTLAVAASDNAWYGWVSDRLCEAESETTPGTAMPEKSVFEGGSEEEGGDVNVRAAGRSTRNHLIPMESTDGTPSPKVVIGHNVGVDRARVLEQYRVYPDTEIGASCSLTASSCFFCRCRCRTFPTLLA